MDPTRDSIATLIADCENKREQLMLRCDLVLSLWPNDNLCGGQALTRLFDREDVEYYGSDLGMWDALDMSWSACKQRDN